MFTRHRSFIVFLFIVLSGVICTMNLLSKSYTMKCKGGYLSFKPGQKIFISEGSFEWLDRPLNAIEKEKIKWRGGLGGLKSKYSIGIDHIAFSGGRVTHITAGYMSEFLKKYFQNKVYYLQVDGAGERFIITGYKQWGW